MDVTKIAITITITGLLIIYLFFKYRHSYWKRKGVTYFEPLFILGNPLSVILKQMSIAEFTVDMHKKIKEQNKKFGGFYVFHNPIFMPTDFDLIKTILVKDFSTFHDRGFYLDDIDLLNAHLINLRGDRWRKSRAKLNPTFTSGKLKVMFDILINCSLELENVFKITTQETVDVRDIFRRYTTDCIANSAFGINCNCVKDPNEEFKKYGDLLIDSTFKNEKLFALAIYFPKLFKLLKLRFINKKIEDFFINVVTQTIKYREMNNIQRKDFMDLYIKLKNENGGIDVDSFSFLDLASAAFVFYVAGFETSETTMTFTMFELCSNQNIQEKVREEILEVLDRHGGEITYDAIMELKYMDKVLCEVLRKYPPIPTLNRETNMDYTIPGTDITIDKGVGCWISVLAMHMDPDIFPEPHRFDPERFSEKEKAKRHPFSYLPFGEGPRVCIGKRFALQQIKIGFTRLLKNYKFTLDPKTVLPLEFSKKGIFINPKNKIWVNYTTVENR